MLVEADRGLRRWLADLVPGSTVTDVPDPAPSITAATVVSVVLLGMSATPMPDVFQLRYLVAPHGLPPDQALTVLDRVLDGVLDSPVLPTGHRVTLEPAAPAPEVWLALGAPMRPALAIQLDAVRVRERPEGGLVLHPPRLVMAQRGGLQGRVVGPAGQPVAEATVTVVSTGATQRTSAAGTFRFAMVPTGTGPLQLSVRTKGHEQVVAVDPTADQPVTVSFTPQEV